MPEGLSLSPARTDNMVHRSLGRKPPKGTFSQDKAQTLWYRIWNSLKAVIFHHSNLLFQHVLLKTTKKTHSFCLGSLCFLSMGFPYAPWIWVSCKTEKYFQKCLLYCFPLLVISPEITGVLSTTY